MKQGTSLDDFLSVLNLPPAKNYELASKKRWSLNQGSRSVADFTVDFHILAAESGWNDPGLKGAF